MEGARRILVVGPSWVGDMVMAQSLFKVLRASFPDCFIDVLAPGWSLPLLERMPEVRAGIEMPLGHGKLGIGLRWRLGLSLRGKYDQAIVLPNSWKSGLVPFAAGIPKRTGWVGEMRYGLLNDVRNMDKSQLTMTVQRFVALAASPDAKLPEVPPPLLIVNRADAISAMRALGLDKQEDVGVLALCPGAEYGPAKQWPHYAELAKRYLNKGWQVWLFGSEKDAFVCQEINQTCDNLCADLSGKTELAQAVDLMSLSDAVVSNDSGLMHVAAALDRPLVAIYGSSDPEFTPPLNAQHQVVALGLPCSPCFKRECPLGHMNCLNNISVDHVDSALEDLRRCEF